MRKRLLYALLFTGVSAGTVMFSPRLLGAQGGGGGDESCPCNGGCEDLKNYNDCGNGTCSWFCS